MADPDINNVVLLANFIGTDEDASYTAEVGGAATFYDGAKLDDTNALFSNTTLYLDGTDDYLTFGSATTFQFLHDKTVDYTVEFWLRIPSLSTTARVLTTRGTGRGVMFTVNTNGSINWAIYKSAGDICYISSSSGVITADTWAYVKITGTAAGAAKVYVDGTLVASGSIGTPDGTPTGLYPLTLGRYAHSSSGQIEEYIGPLRVTDGEALEDTDVPAGIFSSTVTFTGYLSLPGPLGSPTIRALNDFSGLITDYRAFYVMEVSGSPILRIPISSWQATVQTDRASFLQCVIPAADDYVDDLAARLNSSNFSIYRITYLNDEEQKSQLAIAPLETTSYARGPSNYTLTVSGYGDAETASASPATRTMTGLRSIYTTSTGKTRARCDIDWFLRPGDTAVVDGENVTVSYINYYVPSIGDAYMDIGDR